MLLWEGRSTRPPGAVLPSEPARPTHPLLSRNSKTLESPSHGLCSTPPFRQAGEPHYTLCGCWAIVEELLGGNWTTGLEGKGTPLPIFFPLFFLIPWLTLSLAADFHVSSCFMADFHAFCSQHFPAPKPFFFFFPPRTKPAWKPHVRTHQWASFIP